MTPILSVLIPTRNRPQQLLSLLSIIEKCKINRIEFIVSDNSDKKLKDSISRSVQFIRPERVLNMTENWNFLLKHAKGKYDTTYDE